MTLLIPCHLSATGFGIEQDGEFLHALCCHCARPLHNGESSDKKSAYYCSACKVSFEGRDLGLDYPQDNWWLVRTDLRSKNSKHQDWIYGWTNLEGLEVRVSWDKS